MTCRATLDVFRHWSVSGLRDLLHLHYLSEINSEYENPLFVEVFFNLLHRYWSVRWFVDARAGNNIDRY